MLMTHTISNQNTTNMHNMPMHMSFFWSKDVVLLLAEWPGSGRLGMYIIALVVVFLLAVGAEILSVAPTVKSRGLTPAAGASIHTFVFALRMGMSYLIMLSVMSYNLGVFVVAVSGHAVGCFIVKYRALTAAPEPPAVDPTP